MNFNFKQLTALHIVFFISSFTGVLSKLASNKPVFSLSFMIYYVISLLILFGYSVAWQFMLKSFPLSVAGAQRGISTVWTFLWGILLFNEGVSLGKIIAVLLIVAGIAVIGGEK